MSKTDKLICEILEAGYKIEIEPFGDITVAVYNPKLKKGTHYHALYGLSSSPEEQIQSCLVSALHFINENEENP